MTSACIELLLDAADGGFAEACHVMPFPHAQGFSGASEVQRGDVFVRALAVEALARVAERDARVAPVVERELASLLAARRGDGSGWAYFPALPELPSDADDLAAVALAVAAARGVEAAREAVREPMLRWLPLVRVDGTAPTWIPPDDAALRALQERWIAEAWGDTYDVEVAANMVVALAALGATGPVLDALRDAIAARQDDGAWRSTWYWGPFYGTMICTHALRGDGRFDAARARTAAFLAASRRPDGGWGSTDGESNVLETSFALLALDAIGDEPLALDGLRALDAMGDRLREAVPFVRMELGRAQGVVRQTLSYGSAAVNAVYALKATLAWERVHAMEGALR